jgi:predicted O-linked N-acetylglucosamine transferase (SPINDLY family)
MLEAWDEILRKNPSTRLLIISKDDDVQKSIDQLSSILDEFKYISEQSLIIPRLSLEDFMSLAYVADLALDSYPISGGTTTLHSLWMGLPVICIDSENPTSSASSKTLTGVGLTQCVADNRKEFVLKVCELINNKEKLLQLRSNTRSSLLKSPMMDYYSRVDDLTNALINAWNLAAES